MKKVLSFAAVLTLLASLFVFGAYAAKPTEEDIVNRWGSDKTTIEEVAEGLKISFAPGYVAGHRASTPDDVSYDLENLTISLKSVTNNVHGTYLVVGDSNIAGIGYDVNCFTVSVKSDGAVILTAFNAAELQPFFEVTKTLDTAPTTDISMTFSKEGDKWFLTVNGQKFDMPDELLSKVTDTADVGFSLGNNCWDDTLATEEFSFVVADISNGAAPEPGTDDTTAAPAPSSGDTTAKPTTPATGESTVIFAVVAVLAVSAVVLVASKRRSI